MSMFFSVSPHRIRGVNTVAWFMRVALIPQEPHLDATLLLVILSARQAVSFVSQPSQSRRFSVTAPPHVTRLPDASLASRTPPGAPGSPGAPTACDPLARRCRYPLACFSAPGGAAEANTTIVETPIMAENIELEMPELKVLRVDEVPTVKVDPVDPIAREQAKVRSVRVCVRV